ncbi:hypothetical protein UPYG_G00211660 [Umbra pygmaea]|uniref:Uncharacterized protein n=1 Tax=Umbra pygmaea TaxID=75934 RepID=A0ABD0XAE0_UMBPY
MERRQRTTEQGNSESTSSPDLAFILKGLDSMSAGLERLAIRSELRLCDLIVCFSHADKTSFLNRVDEGEPAGPRQAE